MALRAIMPSYGSPRCSRTIAFDSSTYTKALEGHPSNPQCTPQHTRSTRILMSPFRTMSAILSYTVLWLLMYSWNSQQAPKMSQGPLSSWPMDSQGKRNLRSIFLQGPEGP